MNNLDKQYQSLLQDILDNGIKKEDRTGTGTLSVFGRQIRHKMSEGFPLLTTKKMYFKGIVTELLWFLRGDTNIKYLVDNDCHIWDGDAYKNYTQTKIIKNPDGGETHVSPAGHYSNLSKEEFINKIKTDDEFAKKWGELGPVYGAGWRNWNGKIDQISELIEQLKDNPDSRRLLVSAWAVHDLPKMTLPPCHYGFQVYTRELSYKEQYDIWFKNNYESGFEYDNTKLVDFANEYWVPTPKRSISLMWNQRSVDLFLGLPFNIASYGLLLEIIAKEVNMIPDELIGNLGDVHLYLNHIEQAKEQIGEELTLEERYQLALPIWKEKYGPLADMMVMTNVDNTPYKIPTRTREPYPLPKLFFKYEKETYIDNYELDGFVLKDYQSHPTIKAPLSN